MKTGDLVKFKNCSRTGSIGIIIHANGLGVQDVHYVICEGNKRMWFTTNQLEVISENR